MVQVAGEETKGEPIDAEFQNGKWRLKAPYTGAEAAGVPAAEADDPLTANIPSAK